MNNLITRTISGIVFLVILIGAIISDSLSYGVLMLFIIIRGMLEYYKLLLPDKFAIRKVLGLISGAFLFLLLFFCAWAGYDYSLLLLMAIPVFAIFIAELYSKSEQPMQMIATTLSGVIYVALPFSLMNLMVFPCGNNTVELSEFYYDYRMLLAFFIILWTNDVGAYCAGSLLGRSGKHKLFERISPKKSWEGFTGGVILSMLAGFVLYFVWGNNYPVSQVYWIVLGLIVSIFGTLGDLVESMLKRSAGVKDSGNIMPGHGGMLDRFDSVLLSFPLMLIYWQIVI
ncbi:MAG: phosphatidate cytidylyltransferase [Prevotellaceae bacterium]|nr:phosphatidate cytidylyltransferase [Prevotellaceae bacterium]